MTTPPIPADPNWGSTERELAVQMRKNVDSELAPDSWTFAEVEIYRNVAAKVDSELAADLAEDAADLIERHGWIQGAMGGPDTGVCALGGLFYAKRQRANRTGQGVRLQIAEQFVALKLYFDLGMPAHRWNDMPGRTKQEVLDKLRATAKELRK